MLAQLRPSTTRRRTLDGSTDIVRAVTAASRPPAAERTSRSVLYVAKFPPSPSGVALYASGFERVLARDARVTRVRAPADPAKAQRLVAAVRGYLAGRRAARTPIDAVHVELSGRALYEFFFGLGLVGRPLRPQLHITCHDPPSLVGASMLFTFLDRRGARRIGMFLSRHVGARLERRLLTRAEAVFALTSAGREALQLRFGRVVHRIPHVIDDPPRRVKTRSVFFPGPLSKPRLVTEVIKELAAHYSGSEPWEVVFGNCTPDVQRAIGALPIGVHLRPSFMGFVDEPTLLETFARCAIVARVLEESPDNSMAASGPLAWGLARGCLCVTNDRRAGAAELAADGLVIQTRDVGSAVVREMSSWPHHSLGIDIATEAQNRMGVRAVRAYYNAGLSHATTSPAGRQA